MAMTFRTRMGPSTMSTNRRPPSMRISSRMGRHLPVTFIGTNLICWNKGRRGVLIPGFSNTPVMIQDWNRNWLVRIFL
jgi:hypothetical protein